MRKKPLTTIVIQIDAEYETPTSKHFDVLHWSSMY